MCIDLNGKLIDLWPYHNRGKSEPLFEYIQTVGFSYFNVCSKNPIDENHFAGGSSAGSAVIVKSY